MTSMTSALESMGSCKKSLFRELRIGMRKFEKESLRVGIKGWGDCEAVKSSIVSIGSTLLDRI
jgi:hypothetical protein